MVIIISTEGIMGRIKSAWEIALERTENIEVDAEKIRHSANIEAIRKIAGMLRDLSRQLVTNYPNN